MIRKKIVFAQLAKNYKDARPGYPPMAIKEIYAQIKNPKPRILDLGCGTGISTRQLAQGHGIIIGCDIDSKMLAHASTNGHKNINYVRAPAEQLPFDNQSFDAIAMFTSFHWFANKKAVKEIRRVLKPNGVLFIVQPNYKKPHNRELREIINQTLHLNIRRAYGLINFEEFLTKNKFRITRKKNYITIQKYTLNRFIRLLQSYSTWSYVPVGKRPKILKLLKSHYQQYLRNGLIYDRIDIGLICAKTK